MTSITSEWLTKIAAKHTDDEGFIAAGRPQKKLRRSMKIFHLVRTEDVSGVSGTGVVAEGVEFENGKCVICWRGTHSSVAVYENTEEILSIHGHEGRTVLKVIFQLFPGA